MLIRKAVIADTEQIHKLIASFSKKGAMLPRSLNYVYENIRDFWVALEDSEIVGCCALHVVGWEGLAEVKSLSVNKDAQKSGIGKKLVKKCIVDAKKIGVTKVFALTYVPDFFLKSGFNIVEKETLPHKIWSDCIDCPFFPDCNEIAVIKDI